jgi:hypothetical protein
MRTPWVARRDTIQSKPRFLHAEHDGVFANFTIVSLALLRRSANTASELATA